MPGALVKLCSESRSAHLEHGLLLFISGMYEDSWQELSLFEQSSEQLQSSEGKDMSKEEREGLRILVEKARLMSMAVHW